MMSTMSHGVDANAPDRRAGPGAWALLVVGSVIGVMGAALLIAGAGLSVTSAEQRDGGFFTSPTEPFTVDSYAVTSPTLDIAGGFRMPFDLGTLRLQAAAAEPGREVFIGIGPADEVDRYLSSVHHSEVSRITYAPFSVHYRDVAGTRAPAAPASEPFWSEAAVGDGTQHIDWKLRPGTWSLVVMNADASSNVAVNLTAGVHTGLLRPLAIGLLVGGLLLLLGGAAMVVVGAIHLGRRTPPTTDRQRASSDGAVPGYSPAPEPSAEVRRSPVRLTGQLDPEVSRALWLVKWLLAVPHYIVLFFLWFAFFVATVIAGFAILFTGRYPKALFVFNVGVLRWNWRVAFYAYSALGTDRYPPFSLDRTDYPADFDVEYPERLSHGLVLVKWWLLAIPHLLIIAALTGTAWSWWAAWDSGPTPWTAGSRVTGLSLLGILVLIAAIALLFTGRYERALFDLIMGINRWIYRVIAYTALMRDDYPPFRLDQGSTENEVTDDRMVGGSAGLP